jgi:nitrogen fixation protein NifX
MDIQSKLVLPDVKTGAVRVAFASTDGKMVNTHFGKSSQFVYYDVDKENFQLSGKITFTPKELETFENSGHEMKNFARIEALDGCHIVYSQAIGGPVAARLTRKKIQPLVTKQEFAISSILAELQKVLNGPQPPWLRKITKSDDPSRFDSYED